MLEHQMKINVFRRFRGGLNQLEYEKTKEKTMFLEGLGGGLNQLKYEKPRRHSRRLLKALEGQTL